jgi:DNA polymerase-4
MATTATILHADLDAFYASVEQLLDPSLRGKPIAVGGGVVLAASYEAKAFGVRGGMPGRQARGLCPQLTFVSGHFKEYQRLGDAAIKVIGDFTPLVERISIDEAFADVAGCTHLFGSPAEIATAIRQRVRVEYGLPISVGVARTKHLAKIASQVAKPDGLVVVDPDTELQFLHHVPVELMWVRLQRHGWPRSACGRSGSWQGHQDGRLSGCSVPRQERNSQRWHGIAIHAKSRPTDGLDLRERSRRSA